MPRHWSRFVLVFALAATSLIWNATASGPARGAAKGGSFTVAETVISKFGTIGAWLFPQPPGDPPVQCFYPSQTTKNQIITVRSPAAFPVDGLSSQIVDVALAVYQRRPDGTLKKVDDSDSAGTATATHPVLTSNFSAHVDLGSTFIVESHIYWITGNNVTGQVDLLFTKYQTTVAGTPALVLPVTDACSPAKAATGSLDSSDGTVGASIPFKIHRFPHDPNVGIYFDDVKFASVQTDPFGNASSTFVVPAAPMGNHAVKFYRYGRSVTASFTINPRIKLIPNSGLHRGDTVNVSLRGYAAHETVYIRWQQGSTFTQVNHVTTSSTGSANIDIHVPSFAAIGANSVRGDGTFGHAQTNAVTIVVSASSKAAVKSPTPTPSPTTTNIPSTPAATVTPPSTETATQEAATSTPAEPAATATDTPTVAPTQESSVTETPAAPSPTQDAAGTPTNP